MTDDVDDFCGSIESTGMEVASLHLQ